ncbi:MAG TPA: serine/threonine-protein kinase [Candidatus Acidoferrum sp.]|nr:serine/threonine-protein kinase [Candidatus Acidoferrum sp.]
MASFPDSIGPYRVLAQLGEGSMGVVFKAQDQRLARTVALKLIRSCSDDPAKRQRFWQEARAAAQVAHPNACRLYDIAEESGELVLVMEFVEGESLAQRLEQGPLSARQAGQIALELLSALQAFHKLGIVHRDLKPANILLSPHGAKLLDFGIVKNILPPECDETAATLSDTTAVGVFLGTPRYASPEQFNGRAVDARSDIFSFGAILFEMLTAKPVFPGETFAELCHSVLHVAPPALTGSPAIAAMGRIVHSALARPPQDRYQTAEKMAEDLRKALLADGIDTVARAQTLRRMIVLPFRLMRRSEELEFLTYSLPESITVSLSSLENLAVRSSLIAAQYAQDVPDFQKIADETEVDVILTGTLLPVGEQLRITAQLVEVPGGSVLWSHSSDVTVRELLQLHDDLVCRVVQALLPALNPKDEAALRQDRPASPTVYQLYLRANEMSRGWQSLPAAIDLYQECVQLDPRYAPAWARLGRARWLSDKYTVGSTEGLRSADEAFQKAFELSPDLPLAHHLYTHLQVDQGRSLEALQRLLALAARRPSDPELFAGLGHVCRYCGLLQPSLFAHQEARRLDPQIPTTLNHTYFMLGDYERALVASRQDFGYGTALILAILDRVPEAIAMLRQQEDTFPWRLSRLFLTSMRALLEGNREESLRASEEIMRATFRDPEGFYYQARQLSYLGADDWALEMFSRAVDHGFFCYQSFVRDPWLDRLRAKPAFSAIMQKASHLQQEALRILRSNSGDTLLALPAHDYD